MNIDKYLEMEEEGRIGNNKYLRHKYGLDVKPFSQEEAEEYMDEAMACPRCGRPVGTKGEGHTRPQTEDGLCRSCGQKRRRDRIRWERTKRLRKARSHD